MVFGKFKFRIKPTSQIVQCISCWKDQVVRKHIKEHIAVSNDMISASFANV